MKDQNQGKLNKKLSQKLISSEKSFDLYNDSSQSIEMKMSNLNYADSLIIEEEENNKAYVIFLCKDYDLRYDLKLVKLACPSLEQISKVINDDIIINETKWIKNQDLQEYLEISNKFFNKKNKYILKNHSISLENLVEISNFFKNQSLCDHLIINNVIASINRENSIYFLDYSFNKLTKLSQSNSLRKLYDISFEIVMRNFSYYLDNTTKLKPLNDKIIDDLVEKYIKKCNKESNNCYKDAFLSKIIYLLQVMRNTQDIYELLLIESKKFLNVEKQFFSKTEPTLLFSISTEVKNLYKEYSNIRLDKYDLTVSSFYKAFEDCFCLSFKINFENNLNIPILSLFSEVEMKDFQLKSQANSFYINRNKSYSTIFKLQNFSSILKSNLNIGKTSINLQIHLKIDYKQTIILNYLCTNFYRYYNQPSICLLPFRILETIIKNKFLILESPDQVVIALMHWMIEGKNQEEDITQLIESIEFKQVSFELILEFILKFSKHVEKFEYEHILIRLLDSKISEGKSGILDNILNRNSVAQDEVDNSFVNNAKFPPQSSDMIQVLIKSFINVSKKMNISNIYEQYSWLLKEKEKKIIPLTIVKSENLIIQSFPKDQDSISHNNSSIKMNKINFNSYIITEMGKSDIYLNTETPQKIERFKSLDAFPIAKNKLNKSNVDSNNKQYDQKPKSIFIKDEKKNDFFYNVDQNRVNDIRKYNNLGTNLNKSANKTREGNSLNEKSHNKKSYEKIVSNSNISNQNLKTKKIAYLKYNKELYKKK